MLILRRIDGVTAYGLQNNTIYMIGRDITNTNGIHLADKSVSRKHAKAVVKNDTLLVVDLKSSNCTFVNGVTLEPHKPFKVTLGCQIQFGNDAIFVLQEDNMVLATSSLTRFEKEDLNEYIVFFGCSYVLDWKPSITHLLINKFILTKKIMCALIKKQHIVTIDFLKQRRRSIELCLPLPHESEFQTKTFEDKMREEFILNYAIDRRSLFASKLFIFECEDLMQKMVDIIRLAGGRWVVANSELTPKRFEDPLIEYLLVVDEGYTQSNNVHFDALLEYCWSTKQRPIPVQEIAMAIAVAATDVYCNSSHEVKLILKSKREVPLGSELAAESESVIASENSQDARSDIAVCSMPLDNDVEYIGTYSQSKRGANDSLASINKRIKLEVKSSLEQTTDMEESPRIQISSSFATDTRTIRSEASKCPQNATETAIAMTSSTHKILPSSSTAKSQTFHLEIGPNFSPAIQSSHADDTSSASLRDKLAPKDQSKPSSQIQPVPSTSKAGGVNLETDQNHSPTIERRTTGTSATSLLNKLGLKLKPAVEKSKSVDKIEPVPSTSKAEDLNLESNKTASSANETTRVVDTSVASLRGKLLLKRKPKNQPKSCDKKFKLDCNVQTSNEPQQRADQLDAIQEQPLPAESTSTTNSKMPKLLLKKKRGPPPPKDVFGCNTASWKPPIVKEPSPKPNITRPPIRGVISVKLPVRRYTEDHPLPSVSYGGDDECLANVTFYKIDRSRPVVKPPIFQKQALYDRPPPRKLTIKKFVLAEEKWELLTTVMES